MYYEKLENWLHLEETAKKDALGEPELMELLAALRAGNASAKGAIIKGTLHLAFEPGFAWVERSGKRRFDHIINDLYVGIGGVVDEMLENERDDLTVLITDEIRRVTKTVFQADDSTLRVPASTKSTRKKKGKKPYHNLTRVGGCITDAAVAFAESDYGDGQGFSASPEYLGPLTTQSGKRARLASKYRGYEEGPVMVDLLDEFTEEQREIIPLLVENVPLCRIADETSQSLYSTRKLKTQIQGHYGGAPGVFDGIVEMAGAAVGQSDVRSELASSEDAFVEANGLELVVSA
jgi:hypothetical protein